MALSVTALGLGGCAVNYYERSTGTYHVWGFGHLKIKATPPVDGLQAVVTGVETIGLTLNAGQQDYSIGAGWERRHRMVIADDASVQLAWSGQDLFAVKVASAPPFDPTAQPLRSEK